MKNVFFSINRNMLTTREYLENHHGFQCAHMQETGSSIRGGSSEIRDLIKVFWYVCRNRRMFWNVDTLMVLGNSSIVFLLMMKLGFIRVKHFYWFAFFLHNPKVITGLRKLRFLLVQKPVKIIIYSKYEQQYYERLLNIPRDIFRYVPYGYMEPVPLTNEEPEEDYYFAGGYSNRDYGSLIKAFARNGNKLLIIGSRHNEDLNENAMALPPNITIMKDVPSTDFERYLKRARVVIFPFRYNSGAAGQMVTISCMMYKKAMITTDTDIIREYVDDGISGLIIKNYDESLDRAMERMEDPEARKRFGEALRAKFENQFTYHHVTEALGELLSESGSDDAEGSLQTP